MKFLLKSIRKPDVSSWGSYIPGACLMAQNSNGCSYSFSGKELFPQIPTNPPIIKISSESA